MTDDIKYIIGIMSGTSLDGVDIALCSFANQGGRYKYDILKVSTYSYSAEVRFKLSNASVLSGEDLLLLHNWYGEFLGELVRKFINDNDIKLVVAAVSSHGHTIFHQPDNNFSFQLGHGAYIAKQCGLPVIADFRVQDVVYGGQGAPLVPIGDMLLFSEFDVCINIGGITNVSYDDNGQRIAFDICPANIVLNSLVAELDLLFDNYGELARSGVVNTELFERLNALEYFHNPYPKSLGKEWVDVSFVPVISEFNISINDKLATVVEHISYQIYKVLHSHDFKNILITGGGAKNKFLIERINFYLKCNVVVPSELLIDYKEALIFAFLGYLKLQNKINVLSSVTGATVDHSSGVTYDVY